MKVELDSKLLAQGRQGRIYDVTKIDGTRVSNLVAKVYRAGNSTKRLQKFVNYINEKELHSEPALECLPIAYFKNRKWSGIIMKKAMGDTLENSYERLAKLSLSSRIKFSLDVSRGMRKLHEVEIINGDICSSNIMVDMNKYLIRVIDIDGGGILPERIMPSIRGHGGGSWMAPEIFFDSAKLPTIDSDNWALAVLVHTTMIPGLDPFYFLDKYVDIKKLREWPPAMIRDKFMNIHEIQKSYLKACGPIFDLLKVTFNEGIRYPAKRSSASKLEEILRASLRNIIKCGHCKEEIVATNKDKCPLCEKSLIHIVLRIKDKEYPLNSYRQYLTTDDFRTPGDKRLVMFELIGNKIHCKLLNHMIRGRYSGKEINSNETLLLITDKPHLLEFTWNGIRLPLVIQRKNMFYKPNIIKINHLSKVENDNQTINLNNLLSRKIVKAPKKKNIFSKFFQLFKHS